jgi:hypothetical protein
LKVYNQNFVGIYHFLGLLHASLTALTPAVLEEGGRENVKLLQLSRTWVKISSSAKSISSKIQEVINGGVRNYTFFIMRSCSLCLDIQRLQNQGPELVTAQGARLPSAVAGLGRTHLQLQQAPHCPRLRRNCTPVTDIFEFWNNGWGGYVAQMEYKENAQNLSPKNMK